MQRAKTSKTDPGNGEGVSKLTKRSRSAEIASNGIKTSSDMKNFMLSLIPDILDGDVSIAAANATCNAAGKMLKMVELELRYGREGQPKEKESNCLMLTD